MQDILNKILDLKKEKLESMLEIKGIYERRKILFEKDNCVFIEKQLELEKEYVNKINKIDEQISLLTDECKKKLKIEKLEDVNTSEYPQIEKINQITDEIKNIAKICYELNQSNIKLGQKILGDISQKIGQINSKKNNINNISKYNNQINIQSLFFNIKS